MIRRQVGEQFHCVFGDAVAHVEQMRSRPVRADDRAEIGIPADRLADERRTGRRAEQQVLADGRLGVVGAGLERDDEAAQAGLLELVAKGMAHLDDAFGEARMIVRRHGAAQRKIENVLRQLHGIEHRQDRREEIVRAGRTGGLIVDPVAVDVEIRIAGHPRFVDLPFALGGAAALVGGFLQRRMLEAVEQVVAQACRRRNRRRTRHRKCRGR